MKTSLLILLLSFPFFIHAQQSVVSAGGDITTEYGSMSFSTGQSGFEYYVSEAGSMQFGVQQVFFFDDDDDPGPPATRNLTTSDIAQGEDQCFDATQTITLAGGGETFIVDATTGVELIAGHNILMLPGTMVEYGGHMHARISTDGFYCDPEEPVVAATALNHTGQTATGEPLALDDINDPGKPFFKVYPNPTSGDFVLEIPGAGSYDSPVNVIIYGMRGEIIMRHDQLTGKQHSLSLQGHQPGLYVIRLQRGEETGTERIIKH